MDLKKPFNSYHPLSSRETVPLIWMIGKYHFIVWMIPYVDRRSSLLPEPGDGTRLRPEQTSAQPPTATQLDTEIKNGPI